MSQKLPQNKNPTMTIFTPRCDTPTVFPKHVKSRIREKKKLGSKISLAGKYKRKFTAELFFRKSHRMPAEISSI